MNDAANRFTDQLARDVVEPGQPPLERLVERFGASILTEDGHLDRPALRNIVFSDPKARADLEALIAASSTASSLLTPELLARLPDVFPANISVLELTRQEHVVLAGLAAGKRVAELATELHLSPSTVKSHQRNLYRKLDASSREEAVAAAAELGLLV